MFFVNVTVFPWARTPPARVTAIRAQSHQPAFAFDMLLPPLSHAHAHERVRPAALRVAAADNSRRIVGAHTQDVFAWYCEGRSRHCFARRRVHLRRGVGKTHIARPLVPEPGEDDGGVFAAVTRDAARSAPVIAGKHNELERRADLCAQRTGHHTRRAGAFSAIRGKLQHRWLVPRVRFACNRIDLPAFLEAAGDRKRLPAHVERPHNFALTEIRGDPHSEHAPVAALY